MIRYDFLYGKSAKYITMKHDTQDLHLGLCVDYLLTVDTVDLSCACCLLELVQCYVCQFSMSVYLVKDEFFQVSYPCLYIHTVVSKINAYSLYNTYKVMHLRSIGIIFIIAFYYLIQK